MLKTLAPLLATLFLTSSAFAFSPPVVVDVSALLDENHHSYKALFEGAAKEGLVLDWQTFFIKGIGDTVSVSAGFEVASDGRITYQENREEHGLLRPRVVQNVKRSLYPAPAYRIGITRVDEEKNNVFTLDPFAGFAMDSVFYMAQQYVLTDFSGREIARSNPFRKRKTGSYDEESGVGSSINQSPAHTGVKRTGELMKLLLLAKKDAEARARH
jgi:hypothetical protein